MYENNLIESYNLYEIEEKNSLCQIEPNKGKKNVGEELEKNKGKEIVICIMNNMENKIIIIYADNQVLIEEISSMILKK